MRINIGRRCGTISLPPLITFYFLNIQNLVLNGKTIEVNLEMKARWGKHDPRLQKIHLSPPRSQYETKGISRYETTEKLIRLNLAQVFKIRNEAITAEIEARNFLSDLMENWHFRRISNQCFTVFAQFVDYKYLIANKYSTDVVMFLSHCGKSCK